MAPTTGIITTFAVVAGVTGGALSARAVLIVGAGAVPVLPYVLPADGVDRFADRR